MEDDVVSEKWGVEKLIKEWGEEGLIDDFCIRVSNGDHPVRVAKDVYFVPWVRMKEWIKAEPDRIKRFDNAKECYADKLIWDSVEEVKEASTDDVGLRKLRSETYAKIAGVHDRNTYGAKTQIDITETRLNLSIAVTLGKQRMEQAIRELIGGRDVGVIEDKSGGGVYVPGGEILNEVELVTEKVITEESTVSHETSVSNEKKSQTKEVVGE